MVWVSLCFFGWRFVGVVLGLGWTWKSIVGVCFYRSDRVGFRDRENDCFGVEVIRFGF